MFGRPRGTASNADNIIPIPYNSFACMGRTIGTANVSPRGLYHAFKFGSVNLGFDTCTFVNLWLIAERYLSGNDFVGFLKYIDATQRGTQFSGQGYVVRTAESIGFIKERFRLVVGREATDQEVMMAFPSQQQAPPQVIITQPESVLETPSIQDNIREIVDNTGATVTVDLGPTVAGPAPSLQGIIDDIKKIFPQAGTPSLPLQPGTNPFLLLILAAAGYGLYEYFRRRGK